jgi:hypothetical protein
MRPAPRRTPGARIRIVAWTGVRSVPQNRVGSAQRMPHDERMGPLTNITRDDDERAWFVHIERRGQKVTGWFADNVWGDRKNSQIAAQRFRDELLTRVEGDSASGDGRPKARGARPASGDASGSCRATYSSMASLRASRDAFLNWRATRATLTSRADEGSATRGDSAEMPRRKTVARRGSS